MAKARRFHNDTNIYQVAFQIIDCQNRNSEMREGEVCRLAEILHSNKDKPEISAGILFPK